MAEYIEREVVSKMLENAQIISDGEYSGYCTEDINIDDIPTEDVSSVVHGRWEFINDYESRCSACGQEVFIDHEDEFKYCPSCGAKMQEVR